MNEMCIQEVGEMGLQFRTQLHLKRTEIWISASTMWLMTTHNSSPKESDTFFWISQACGTHTHMQNKTVQILDIKEITSLNKKLCIFQETEKFWRNGLITRFIWPKKLN